MKKHLREQALKKIIQVNYSIFRKGELMKHHTGLEHRPMLGHYKQEGNHIKVTAKSEKELEDELDKARNDWMSSVLGDWVDTEAWWMHRANNFGIIYANEMGNQKRSWQ